MSRTAFFVNGSIALALVPFVRSFVSVCVFVCKYGPCIYRFCQQISIFHFFNNCVTFLSLLLFHPFAHPIISPHQWTIRFGGAFLLLLLFLVLYAAAPIPDLSKNRLAKVTNNAFVNLSNLTYLDLSYNKLVKLESASVEPLKILHTLNISGNIQMDLYDIREAFQVISLYISCLLPHSPTLVPFHYIYAYVLVYLGHLIPLVQCTMRGDAMWFKSIYIPIWATLIHRWSLSSLGRNFGHLQINNINHFAPFFFLSFCFFFTLIHHWFVQILHNLKTLSIADMGVIPYELLVPFGQLKALNLSGNHLVNVSMQILQPVNGLEVSIAITICSEFIFSVHSLIVCK